MASDAKSQIELCRPSPRAAHVEAILGRARQNDLLGYRVHLGLAMLFLFTLPLATAPKEYPFGALVIWSCIRLRHTWRSYAHVMFTPVLMALLLWSAWHVVSFGWSSDWRQGFDELGAQRVLLLPLLLWPILDRVPWLIGAALAGVLAQNAAQLLQALDWVNLRPQEAEGRYGGWMHPIKTGAWCAAAMCWHVSASLHSRGTIRWISIALLGVASLGLIATESRGPWLAAAMAVPLMLVVIAARRPAARKLAAALAVAGLLAAAAAWPVIGQGIVDRIRDAQVEARHARERGAFWTSVGVRIGMAQWAWDMFKEHPVAGIGAGAYPQAQAEHPTFRAALAEAPSESARRYMTKAHPHSTYFYALACTGAIGAALLAAVLVLALRRCWVDPPDHLYADGTLFALMSWIIGAQFDCYNLDSQRLGLLALIIGVTLPVRRACQRMEASSEAREL